MMDWFNSTVVAAALTGAVTILLAGLGAIAAWARLKRLGINESNVVEVTDRAQFRKDMFEQIRDMRAEVASIKLAEQECQDDRRKLLKENLALERRVFDLEKKVNGSHP